MRTAVWLAEYAPGRFLSTSYAYARQKRWQTRQSASQTLDHLRGFGIAVYDSGTIPAYHSLLWLSLWAALLVNHKSRLKFPRIEV